MPNPGCQAGGLRHKLQYLREFNAESPKQGSKRRFAHLGMINLREVATDLHILREIHAGRTVVTSATAT